MQRHPKRECVEAVLHFCHLTLGLHSNGPESQRKTQATTQLPLRFKVVWFSHTKKEGFSVVSVIVRGVFSSPVDTEISSQGHSSGFCILFFCTIPLPWLPAFPFCSCFFLVDDYVCSFTVASLVSSRGPAELVARMGSIFYKARAFKSSPAVTDNLAIRHCVSPTQAFHIESRLHWEGSWDTVYKLFAWRQN